MKKKIYYIEYGNDPRDPMTTSLMTYSQVSKIIGEYQECYNFADICSEEDY